MAELRVQVRMETVNWSCPSLQYNFFPILLLSEAQVPTKKKRTAGLNQTWHFAGRDEQKDKEVESLTRMGSI